MRRYFVKILEVQNFSYKYPKQENYVLENIQFSIKEGDLYILCGQSGCGKSTLLRSIKKHQLMVGEKEGFILFRGTEIEEMDNRENAEKIGFVGQNPDGQMVTDKVWHELAFGLESLGCSNENIRRRVAEMAEYFGISDLFEKSIDTLSGGQKQIVNLAAVMVMQPDLLLLDEPTSQLDPIAAERFIQTIQKINQDFGVTILMSEHRLAEVFPIANGVLVMHQGKLEGAEKPKLCGTSIYQSKSPVYAALPETMKLFLELGEEGEAPITIREGVQWLRKKELSDNPFRLENRLRKKEIKERNRKLVEKKKPVFWKNSKIKKRNQNFALVAKNISYSYEKKATKILKDFQIQIPKGCIYAIMGGNGSGKTTCLKILAEIYKPQSGSCKKKGQVVYLPQNPQLLFTEPTVCEELEEVFFGHPKLFAELTETEIVEQIEHMLQWLELEEYQNRHPYDLSGGQQQRLAFAKILLLKPDILLLDEPTKGLDAAFKGKMSQLFQELKQKGITIVLVSHDVDFCAENADYCGLLFQGEFTQIETTNEFFKNNYFYTTATSRLLQRIAPEENLITHKQALQWLKRKLGVIE